MSTYTTGELAKLCGVSVRTVQYYDSRGILVPGSLSEGGRRLYGEEDVRKLKVICFLRGIGLSINSISGLLSEAKPDGAISILLDQQTGLLRDEIREREGQLRTVEELKQEMRKWPGFSVESIQDIAFKMENKKKLHRVYAVMISLGIVADIIEWGTLLLWIFGGNWRPFAIGMPVVFAICSWVVWYYHRHVAYICPQCHEVFKPKFWTGFLGWHTPRTRRMRCPKCGFHGYCVATYGKKEDVLSVL